MGFKLDDAYPTSQKTVVDTKCVETTDSTHLKRQNQALYVNFRRTHPDTFFKAKNRQFTRSEYALTTSLKLACRHPQFH